MGKHLCSPTLSAQHSYFLLTHNLLWIKWWWYLHKARRLLGSYASAVISSMLSPLIISFTWWTSSASLVLPSSMQSWHRGWHIRYAARRLRHLRELSKSKYSLFLPVFRRLSGLRGMRFIVGIIRTLLSFAWWWYVAPCEWGMSHRIWLNCRS